MGAKKIKYNLSSHGQLTIYLYPYANKIFEVLSENNYDAKFNQTNQLGALKRVLPGAHYTRYEYILLQWYLIHELSKRGINTGLSSKCPTLQNLVSDNLKVALKKDELGELSGGDLLQCIVLLSNMGHFPDTFSASRVWCNILKNNILSSKIGVMNGLGANQKSVLKKILDSDDIYHIHYINALFMINRLKNSQSSKAIMQFASDIFLEFINSDKDEYQKYWNIYYLIRNLSYLILDSSYAPIPLNIELASLVSNMEQIFGKHVNSNSIMNTALKQLEKVLEDTVYLSGNSLIATAIRSAELESEFMSNAIKIVMPDNTTRKSELHKLSNIRDLLEPTKKDSNSLAQIFNKYSSYENPVINWDTENCLDIKFSNINTYSDYFRSDHYSWEKELHKICGSSVCNVAIFGNPLKEHLRMVFSRNTSKSIRMQMTALCNFVSQVMTLHNKLDSVGYKNDYELENLKNIYEFFIKSSFKWNYEVTFEWDDIKNSPKHPFFVSKGSKKLAKEIDEYIKSAETYITSCDKLNEFKCTSKVLNSQSYRGLIMAYIGATKLWDTTGKNIAEFDGIILYPNGFNGTIISIVEAKNMSNGNTVAQNQLNQRMQLLDSTYTYKNTYIERKGAYASISYKD